MSVNIYQIHIKTDKMKEVEAFLVNWLEVTYSSEPITHSNQNSHFSFFNSEIPSHFALSKMHDNWITILHDSYTQLMDLTSKLSSTFNTLVIHALGQSTVDTYNLMVFQSGKLVRKIDYGEGYFGIEQYGEPLSFEKGPIGTKVVLEEQEESYYFDYIEMREYCLHFNIDILIDPSEKDGMWEVIQIQHPPPPRKNSYYLPYLEKFFHRRKNNRK
ncbi:hypothetical protein [Sutcliffiella horikoshii]|uniref:hypothetical protein n=1 Tax=Sutcliffiella horikoshii TaxID=79883 RepID=UPI001CFF2F57|nr:hypothetical protein [Sutcliffiella horikoshii]